MTLYSKANLQVAAIASANPYDGPLNGVFLDPDGSTVACDGNGLLAVGPARDVHFPDVGKRGTPGAGGIVLKPDFVEEAARIIPKDKRLSLQHVALTIGAEPQKTEFATIDKSGRVRRVAEYAKRERYPDWRAVAQKAIAPKITPDGSPGRTVRVAVGRKTLLAVLRALVDACPETGDAPVILEIGSGVVLRATNRETGQRVVGVASAFAVADDAIAPDAWERTVLESREISSVATPTSAPKKAIKKIARRV
jgi:hypothetical protein